MDLLTELAALDLAARDAPIKRSVLCQAWVDTSILDDEQRRPPELLVSADHMRTDAMRAQLGVGPTETFIMSRHGGALVRVLALSMVVSVATTTRLDRAGAADVVPLPLVDAVASEAAELVVDLSADDRGPASGSTITWTTRVENRSPAASPGDDPYISVGTGSGTSALAIVDGSLPPGWNVGWEDPGGTQVAVRSPNPIAIGDAVEFAVTTVASGPSG